MNWGRSGWPSRALGGFAALTFLTAALTSCSGDTEPQPSPSSPTTSQAPRKVTLTVGVFGAPPERDAFTKQAAAFQEPGTDVTVETRTYSGRDQAVRAYRTGDLPDVFMLSQRDLAAFTDEKLTHPVDELLDERGVSFGDDYSRDSLAAFSTDNSLACMPYSVSPMVMYINTDLVNFNKMRRRGLDAPEIDEESGRPEQWTFDQFTAAAQFATRPGKHSRGVYIDPSLLGLAPFIYSGGGKVFDDDRNPTSLAFSDGDTQAALETTLTLLRNAQVTPTPDQLNQHTPLKLFEKGRLGMIAGFRGLTPRLRLNNRLNFDVMPMPKIGRSATVGDVTGLCISANTEHLDEAADLMVHLLSDEAMSAVARAGYLVPSKVSVATSDAFLQPGRQPANAAVFNQSVRAIQVPPLLDSWSRLQTAVAPLLQQLVTAPFGDDTLQDLTERIDEASRTVLSPETESDSASPSESPSG